MAFQDIAARLAATPHPALFLDFDGTLVDIAPRPDAVVVEPALVRDLGALADRLGGGLAVVSGRPVAEIDRWLSPLVLPAAGAHGRERRRADGTRAPEPELPDLTEIDALMRALAAKDARLAVEPKAGALALHYRAAPEAGSELGEALSALVGARPDLTLLAGKMVYEVKSAAVTKGAAILAFLEEPPFRGRTPIFMGDDVTDEDGFTAVAELGGLGVKIGEGETAAQLRLDEPADLRRLIAAVVRP